MKKFDFVIAAALAVTLPTVAGAQGMRIDVDDGYRLGRAVLLTAAVILIGATSVFGYNVYTGNTIQVAEAQAMKTPVTPA